MRSKMVIGCAIVALLVLPDPGPASANPRPPTAAEIGAAAGQPRGSGGTVPPGLVSQRQAQLGNSRKRLSAANAELASLQTRAEVLTERYDQTVVNEQRAQAGYQVTLARLASAEQAQRSSRQRVAGLAAEEFESGGGFGAVGVGAASAMVGDTHGPDAYLSGLSLGQLLTQQRTDALAAQQANDVVAKVFRTQAHNLLVARQADLRAASYLKLAIQAAVARQQAFVRADKDVANRAVAALAAAQSHEAALRAARQAALAAAQAAAAARQAAAASRQAATAGGPSVSVEAPAWSSASGASATQGDVAANWALSQLGKPYLWGGAGPGAYDCSGLTMVAWAHAGVQLLHWTGYQWIAGPHVPLGQLQRGDLVFYATKTSDPATIHHVGIYIGNGTMVDAPYTGAFVRVDGIYRRGLIGAVRPAG